MQFQSISENIVSTADGRELKTIKWSNYIFVSNLVKGMPILAGISLKEFGNLGFHLEGTFHAVRSIQPGI
jgi:hypothetical protein